MSKVKDLNYKFVKNMPTLDLLSKKLKRDIELVDKCNIVSIKCMGVGPPINLQATAKDQTRKLGPKVKKLSCSDSLASLESYCVGDPGSVFTFECPMNCGSGGTLIGAGL